MSTNIRLKSGTYYFSLANDDIIQGNDLVRFNTICPSSLEHTTSLYRYANDTITFFVGKTKANLATALGYNVDEFDVDILREIS